MSISLRGARRVHPEVSPNFTRNKICPPVMDADEMVPKTNNRERIVAQPSSWKEKIGRNASCLLVLQATPLLAFGQTSPFDTGADSLLTWALGIAMPIAALFIIGLGIAALVGRISWGLAVGCIVGIALIFGAPQIVTWMRDIFGV